MAKMKVTVEFECDIGDQTLEETKQYLAQSHYFEVLEWISNNGKTKFTFEEVDK